jgi:hypothetical protein
MFVPLSMVSRLQMLSAIDLRRFCPMPKMYWKMRRDGIHFGLVRNHPFYDKAKFLFYITAYAMERQLGAGTSWSMLMDDRDVAQLLPLREDQFYQGVSLHSFLPHDLTLPVAS